MSNINDQLSRMKAMMNYGVNAESKNTYSSVEYQREGADNKMYGIVREGAKFYIKIASKMNNLVNEDFNYIGGFRNRKDNEYSSYANALKNFDLKMMMIKESHNNGKVALTESWNPDKQEFLAVESTSKMQKEIERQRQIMNNAVLISEQKSCKPSLMEEKSKGPKTAGMNDPFKEKTDNKEADATQKTNVSKGGKSEAPTGKKGDEGYIKAKVEGSVACQSPKGGKVVKESEVLGWNNNKDYLDKAHGTTIGSGAPFDEKDKAANQSKSTKSESTPKETEEDKPEETVVEAVMHQEGENQNSPKPGIGEIGDTAPFDKKVNESEEDEEISGDEETLEEAIGDFDSMDDDTEEVSSEFDTEEKPFGEDDFSSFEDDETESIGNEDDEMDARISSMEGMIAKIAEKLGIADVPSEPSIGDEDNIGGDDLYGDDEKIDKPIQDCSFYESRSHKIAMLEDRLDDFGKHPAYQKKVMELPPSNQKEKEGYYDMNDDSVKNDKPFGSEIGDTAPFDIKPKDIQDAIAESLTRLFKKKR